MYFTSVNMYNRAILQLEFFTCLYAQEVTYSGYGIDGFERCSAGSGALCNGFHAVMA